MRLNLLTLGTLALGLTVAAQAPHAAAQTVKKISVPITGSKGDSVGTATFKTVKNGVKVKIDLHGLSFGAHGVHIHQNAVCDAPDFKGAGGHFNPDMKQHGFNNPMGHHNGDLPESVMIGEGNTGEATFVLTSISLDPAAPNSVFLNGGTAIVVHEKADDEKTDPSGASGNRIACGIIKR